ncbi:SulP family inorganic anion transporter [Methylobacterium sp. P1-11]|uniref:SulP family inorganic anion transporter n=1 Tax=Methylobacterium sp. P1-11 TaxID=2024616 RepID=UPI0032B16E87
MRDPGTARRTEQKRVPPDLGRDVVAGLAAATVVLPKAMAYATVAGLPVSVGLYDAFVPPLIYGLLGSLRVLCVSSTTTLTIPTGPSSEAWLRTAIRRDLRSPRRR